MVTKKKRIEFLEKAVATLELQVAALKANVAVLMKRKAAEDSQPKGKSAQELLREYLLGEQK